MMLEKGKEYLEEFKGQVKKNKHQIIKLLIALLVTPVMVSVLDTYILGEGVPMQLTVFMSIWVTYMLLSIYDGVITRETQRAKNQIIKNTLSIIVIEEDIRNLQKEVYKESTADVRARNYVKAKRRRGESLLGGDFNETRPKN